MKRSIVLNAKQNDFLENEADRIGITVSELIRRILDQHRMLGVSAPWLAQYAENKKGKSL
jgi:hypothetical protein